MACVWLEFQPGNSEVVQFFVSSRPEVPPSQIVRSVKGRLQYLVKRAVPQLWRRHYAISSVGDANNEALERYVGRQVKHHPMADARVTERLMDVQFHDPSVDLAALRASAQSQVHP